MTNRLHHCWPGGTRVAPLALASRLPGQPLEAMAQVAQPVPARAMTVVLQMC